jgi:hypothetical protein
LGLKQRLKEIGKRRSLQRTEGARYGYSVSKQTAKKEVGVTQAAAAKFGKYDDYYAAATDTINKKLGEIKVNSPLKKSIL